MPREEGPESGRGEDVPVEEGPEPADEVALLVVGVEGRDGLTAFDAAAEGGVDPLPGGEEQFPRLNLEFATRPFNQAVLLGALLQDDSP